MNGNTHFVPQKIIQIRKQTNSVMKPNFAIRKRPHLVYILHDFKIYSSFNEALHEFTTQR